MGLSEPNLKLARLLQTSKMVFTSLVNFVKSRGPDEFWRKRRIFKLAAHFRGRKRNCYSIAIRYVHRALVYATKGRKLKKLDMKDLWETRINAGCEQHGISSDVFKECLARQQVMLNRKALADLACWEPFTFKALTDVAHQAAQEQNFDPKQSLTVPKIILNEPKKKF